MVELSHRSCTRNSEASYRLGWGEVTAPGDIPMMLRLSFLLTLDRLVPECKADLRTIYAFRKGIVASTCDASVQVRPDWPFSEIVEWCRTYHLCDPKKPAEWVLQLVANSFRLWFLVRGDQWAFSPSGHGSLTTEEERSFGGRYRYNPETERRDQARRRLPERYWADVDRLTHLALERSGVIAPWRCEPEHVDWFVRYQVQEQSEAEIATEYSISADAIEELVDMDQWERSSSTEEAEAASLLNVTACFRSLKPPPPSQAPLAAPSPEEDETDVEDDDGPELDEDGDFVYDASYSRVVIPCSEYNPIVRRINAGESVRQIAADYGVTEDHIRSVQSASMCGVTVTQMNQVSWLKKEHPALYKQVFNGKMTLAKALRDIRYRDGREIQMKLSLPQFNPSDPQRQWVNGEAQTARFVSALWRAGGRKQRDPGFIALLARCAWTNVRGDESGWESTRIWRNQNIADYLGVEYVSDKQLAEVMSRAFPRLKRVQWLLGTHTGITHYYKALRTETIAFVESHARQISKAFSLVASTRVPPLTKIARAVNLIDGLGPIRIRGLDISPLNGLTPALACLEPSHRFPIMNEKTRRLLRAIGREQDAEGAIELSKLIGPKSPGVRNAFELDVYAATHKFAGVRRPSTFKSQPGKFRDVGEQSEIASIAHIAANRVKIRKKHNELTNRLLDWLAWRYPVPKESRFDAAILNWRKRRHLLIEVKTAWAGPSGRMQIRQAIGQLFDYRHTYASHFPPGEIDLAHLLPSQPSSDLQSLLKTVKIEVLWFERGNVTGTIAL